MSILIIAIVVIKILIFTNFTYFFQKISIYLDHPPHLHHIFHSHHFFLCILNPILRFFVIPFLLLLLLDFHFTILFSFFSSTFFSLIIPILSSTLLFLFITELILIVAINQYWVRFLCPFQLFSIILLILFYL